jgi:hypothetical protein
MVLEDLSSNFSGCAKSWSCESIVNRFWRFSIARSEGEKKRKEKKSKNNQICILGFQCVAKRIGYKDDKDSAGISKRSLASNDNRLLVCLTSFKKLLPRENWSPNVTEFFQFFNKKIDDFFRKRGLL